MLMIVHAMRYNGFVKRIRNSCEVNNFSLFGNLMDKMGCKFITYTRTLKPIL